MSYLNSITLVGFVGSDPEQRQAKGNGSKFTVLSVATQRSCKNADDEWSSKTECHRVVVFRPLLAERVATTIKKGAHVLVEGSLVSSTYEQPNGKAKKSKTLKITSWSVRADARAPGFLPSKVFELCRSEVRTQAYFTRNSPVFWSRLKFWRTTGAEKGDFEPPNMRIRSLAFSYV